MLSFFGIMFIRSFGKYGDSIVDMDQLRAAYKCEGIHATGSPTSVNMAHVDTEGTA